MLDGCLLESTTGRMERHFLDVPAHPLAAHRTPGGGNTVKSASIYKAGSQPHSGYIAWHEWAAAQIKSGLRQRRCKLCSLFRFPQEMTDKGHCRKCNDL